MSLNNAARVGRGFDHGLRIALVHSGDSDSTAAIAGNLLGLLYPDQVLASQMDLECRDLIARLARDLAAARDPGESFADDMFDLYPGW